MSRRVYIRPGAYGKWLICEETPRAGRPPKNGSRMMDENILYFCYSEAEAKRKLPAVAAEYGYQI